MIPKFRAWLKEEEEMQDVLAFDTRGHSFLGIEGTNVRVEGWCDYFEVGEQAVIMQSSGYDDINGVEMFHGDIVWDEFNKRCGVLLFDRGAFRIMFAKACPFLFVAKDEVRVIGDVFRNSELLEDYSLKNMCEREFGVSIEKEMEE